MLGMAVDAAARSPGRTSRRSTCCSAPEAAEIGRRPRQPARIGMIVDVGVAGRAGRVAHRDERLDVAGLAIVAQRGMALREAAARATSGRHGSPARSAPPRVRVLIEGPDRPGEEEAEHEQRRSVQAIGRLPGITEASAKRPTSSFSSAASSSARARSRSRRRPTPAGVGMTRSRNGPIRMSPPGCEVDLAEAGCAAVDLDRQAHLGRDAELAVRDQLDRRVVERDGEVVEADVAIGVAADLQERRRRPREVRTISRPSALWLIVRRRKAIVRRYQ